MHSAFFAINKSSDSIVRKKDATRILQCSITVLSTPTMLRIADSSQIADAMKCGEMYLLKYLQGIYD